jgi:diguanylate cyclase (GGDEF)-like protein
MAKGETRQPREGVERHFNFSVLKKRLAEVNLRTERSLATRIVRLVATCLNVKRVSLVRYDVNTGNILGINSTGFKAQPGALGETRKLVDRVARYRRPFVCGNIEDFPELVSPHAKTYKTPACAVYPLMFQDEMVGVLCLSDLSAAQTQELSQRETEADSIAEQIAQLIYHSDFLRADNIAVPARRDERGRFFILLDEFIENINLTWETENTVDVFTRLLADILPVRFWGMIFDPLDRGEEAAVCLAGKTSDEEVKWLLAHLMRSWPKKPNLQESELSNVRIVGDDLLVETGGMAPEQGQRIELAPVYLDNNMFGLLGIVVPQEYAISEDTRQFIKVLSHHLSTHIKKNYLMAANEELDSKDRVTGLYNQRHFFNVLEREFERSSRYNVPFTLLFLDVDHFKDVNDTYGVEEGHNVLREISRILQVALRSTDHISRYSGERFVIALTETGLREAEMVANRLRRLVANHSFYISQENLFIKVTASIGVTSFLDHRPRSVAQFIEFADTALYFAKRNGRNQVVSYTYVINLMMSDVESQG